MKTIKITLTLKMTDEYYKDEIKALKNQIESKSFQKQMMKDYSDKIIKVKAKIELL